MIKTLGKNFVLEISEEDISIVVEALNELYILKTNEYKEHGGEKIYNKKASARALRNDFASLIGRTYMGEDA